MIGGYIAGADVIKLTCSSPITRKTRADVRAFLRDTRGMEIEVDDEKEIRIVSILNPSELRLQVSINRMYILISSLVNDAFDVLSGESVELLSDIDDRERQIDARRLLLERQVAASLQQPSVERKLGIDRFSAMEHANIARILERMGDHATRLAHLVKEHSDCCQDQNQGHAFVGRTIVVKPPQDNRSQYVHARCRTHSFGQTGTGSTWQRCRGS